MNYTKPIPLEGAHIANGKIVFDQPFTLASAVNSVGLRDLSDSIAGDTFVVCDLSTHGVQGCADMRTSLQRQELMADACAIGLMLLVAVLVGSLAVAFTHLLARAVRPLRREQARPTLVPANDHDPISEMAA